VGSQQVHGRHHVDLRRVLRLLDIWVRRDELIELCLILNLFELHPRVHRRHNVRVWQKHRAADFDLLGRSRFVDDVGHVLVLEEDTEAAPNLVQLVLERFLDSPGQDADLHHDLAVEHLT
jgi:hypothetical protein